MDIKNYTIYTLLNYTALQHSIEGMPPLVTSGKLAQQYTKGYSSWLHTVSVLEGEEGYSARAQAIF